MVWRIGRIATSVAAMVGYAAGEGEGSGEHPPRQWSTEAACQYLSVTTEVVVHYAFARLRLRGVAAFETM